MDNQEQSSAANPGGPEQGWPRARRVAKATGAFLLLWASRLWAGLVRGWQELGRRDAADIAAAREKARAAGEGADGGQGQRRRSIAAWLPKRRSAAVALLLLALLLLWRCGRDGAPTGNRPGVASGPPAAACNGLLGHEAWTGRIAFSHQRDVTSADGEDHLSYAFTVDVGAQLAERTRRQHRGADYLVQYFHPEPRGRVDARQVFEQFDHLGLAYRSSFVGNGRLQRHEEDMSEDGSMLSLTLKADCSYTFHLQGQAMGKSEVYSRRSGDARPDDMLWLPGLHGSGIAGDGSRLSGTRDFKLMSWSHLDETRHLSDRGDWILERDLVEDVLGRDNLGTVSVTWEFEAVD